MDELVLGRNIYFRVKEKLKYILYSLATNVSFFPLKLKYKYNKIIYKYLSIN